MSFKGLFSVAFSVAVVAMMLFSFSSSAFARLGESSSLSDKSSSFRKVQVPQSAIADSYTVNQTSDDGVTLTEYLNSDGVVFAVKWQGEYQPNLSDIFGAYYDEYQTGRAAVKNSYRGSRSHQVTTDHLSVDISGHMRSMRGFAYLPKLVPHGINIGQLK